MILAGLIGEIERINGADPERAAEMVSTMLERMTQIESSEDDLVDVGEIEPAFYDWAGEEQIRNADGRGCGSPGGKGFAAGNTCGKGKGKGKGKAQVGRARANPPHATSSVPSIK